MGVLLNGTAGADIPQGDPRNPVVRLRALFASSSATPLLSDDDVDVVILGLGAKNKRISSAEEAPAAEASAEEAPASGEEQA
jgi:hypothetical protein